MREVTGILIESDKGEQAPDLAVLFSNLTADQQARFFNLVAHEVKSWSNHATFQWRMMQEDLTPEGRQLLVDLYQHTGDE